MTANDNMTIATATTTTIVAVHPDLGAFIRDMCDWNGLSIKGYTNNLLEIGIRQDLLSAEYTEESINKFLNYLRMYRNCDWTLLQRES